MKKMWIYFKWKSLEQVLVILEKWKTISLACIYEHVSNPISESQKVTIFCWIADSLKFPQHGLPAPVRKKDVTRIPICYKITPFYEKSSFFRNDWIGLLNKQTETMLYAYQLAIIYSQGDAGIKIIKISLK